MFVNDNPAKIMLLRNHCPYKENYDMLKHICFKLRQYIIGCFSIKHITCYSVKLNKKKLHVSAFLALGEHI